MPSSTYRDTAPTIVIIGGGFSGTVTAAQLLRGGFGAHGRVLIINRSGAMARGVAYGTNADQHLLNVPAGRMSALDDDPDDFIRFLRRRGMTADGGSFVSRHLYGAYLESLLVDASARASADAFARRCAEVVTIDPAVDGTHAWVVLDDGSRIRADRVVLAIGNYPPEDPLIDGRERLSSPRYIRDPWCPDAIARVDRRQSVLLIGTGLTMIDIAFQLQTLGNPIDLIAVSRRGLLPKPHRSAGAIPDHGANVTDLLLAPPTLRAYVRTVRRCVREAAAQGFDWRDVLAALRPLTPRLWRALPVAERARFLRHVRPFWDVHRHRIAPQLFDAFARLRETGQITIHAGRLLAVREHADRWCVRLRLRGSIETREIEVGTIINCSGPAGDTRRLRDTLFESLQARGLLRPDPLGLGIETSTNGAVIGRGGSASRVLYYVGPFLRARDWEATAVPELRAAARLTAEHLLAHLTLTLRAAR